MSEVFSRVWAMPNSRTFLINPIADLIERYIRGVSVDPFACDSTLCDHSNDIRATGIDALDWMDALIEDGVVADTVLIDPPYSPRQIAECYKEIGRKVTQQDTQCTRFMREVRTRVDRLLTVGGTALFFGWNSCGMGRKYERLETLLVAHGGARNDTICVVDRKLCEQQELEL